MKEKNEGFILTPNTYTQEQWCEIYFKVVEEYQKAKENQMKIKEIILKSYKNIDELYKKNIQKEILNFNKEEKELLHIIYSILHENYSYKKKIQYALYDLNTIGEDSCIINLEKEENNDL